MMGLYIELKALTIKGPTTYTSIVANGPGDVRRVCELRCFENTYFDIRAFVVSGIYRKFSFLHFYLFYQVYIIYSIR